LLRYILLLGFRNRINFLLLPVFYSLMFTIIIFNSYSENNKCIPSCTFENAMITINNNSWSYSEKNNSFIEFYPGNEKENSTYFKIIVRPIVSFENLLNIVSNQEEILQSQNQSYDFRGLEKLRISGSNAYGIYLINNNSNYIDSYYTVLNDAVLYKFQYFAQNKITYDKYKQFVQNIIQNIKFHYKSPSFQPYQSGVLFPNTFPTFLASYDVNELLYVYIDSTKQILVIDGESGTILDSIYSKNQPKKLLFDPINNMLYVSYFSDSLLKIFEFDSIGSKFINSTEIEFNNNINDFEIDNNGFHGSETLIFVSLEGIEKNTIQIVDNNIGDLTNYSSYIKDIPSVDDITIDPVFNTMYIIDYDDSNLTSSILGYHYLMDNNKFTIDNTISKNLNGYITDLSLFRKNNSIYALNFNNQTLHILQNSNQTLNEKSIKLNISLPMKGFIDENKSKLYVSSPLVDDIEIFDLDKDIKKQNNGTLFSLNNSKPFDIIYNEGRQKMYFIDRNSHYLKVFDTQFNKLSTWITFKINFDTSINPENFGLIKCNTYPNGIPINKSVSILYDNTCEYVPNNNSKYEFVKWEVNSENPDYPGEKTEIDDEQISLNSSKLIKLHTPISVTAILKNTDMVQIFRDNVDTYGEFISVIGLLTVLISGIIANVYYNLKKSHSDRIESKWILQKEQIFTIDGTIIVGVLIFLTISGVEEQHQISIITSLIVVPFVLSSILAIFDFRTQATILIISGMINLILAILILANMSTDI